MTTLDQRRDNALAGTDDDAGGAWATRIFLQPIAAPSILGLAGFSVATMMVALIQAGWLGSWKDLPVVGIFAATFGGIAQFSAGLWAYRARDGVARLGTLVRAMSEASRMERAIAAAEPEDVDLREVVRGCAEAYRSLAGTRTLACELPGAALPMHCAPELIAQALDKLFDNALSFTPADGWLRLSLSATADGARIELANQGAPLPAAMAGRLFDSLVSVRDRATPGDAPHLGLGLYVVRLVAERHGGSATAHNLPDGNGVAFSLVLHNMPRVRL